jgi:hypothetical protein
MPSYLNKASFPQLNKVINYYSKSDCVWLGTLLSDGMKAPAYPGIPHSEMKLKCLRDLLTP